MRKAALIGAAALVIAPTSNAFYIPTFPGTATAIQRAAEHVGKIQWSLQPVPSSELESGVCDGHGGILEINSTETDREDEYGLVVWEHQVICADGHVEIVEESRPGGIGWFKPLPVGYSWAVSYDPPPAEDPPTNSSTPDWYGYCDSIGADQGCYEDAYPYGWG